ncbi:hypothetical protein GCM10025794_27300 [Massilia kyonggiensis]
MHDLADIADWLQTHAIHHDTPVHDTLPDPVFKVNGEAAVSFSTTANRGCWAEICPCTASWNAGSVN